MRLAQTKPSEREKKHVNTISFEIQQGPKRLEH